MTMPGPQRPQRLVGQIRQRHETVLVTLAAADMHAPARPVDIADLKGEGLAQAQTHGIGREHKDAIAQLARRVDQPLHLIDGEDIRQGAHLWWLDHLHPLPVAVQDMLVEELQPVAVDAHGGPGAPVDQIGEVLGQLLAGEPIGHAVEVLGHAAHRAGVDIDGAGTVAVQLERAHVPVIQCAKMVLFAGDHR